MRWYNRLWVIIICIIPLVGCAQQRDMQKGKISFLALGDSYTIGEAVPLDKAWPNQLQQALNKAQVPVSPPQIIAKTGWTTDELLAAIDEKNPQGPFDMVSLLIGVNNQYRGYNFEQYTREFETLLKKAIALAGGKAEHVFVVSIPDYSVTPFAAEKDPPKIAKELVAYNAENQRIAKAYGVEWFNITPISLQAKDDVSLLAEDALHPGAKMYAQWVALLMERLPAKIKSWQ